MSLCSRGRGDLVVGIAVNDVLLFASAIEERTKITPSPRTKSISIFRFATFRISGHFLERRERHGDSHSRWCDLRGLHRLDQQSLWFLPRRSG